MNDSTESALREEPLRIFWNRKLKGKISSGKLAAHAAHAALAAYGIKYTHPIVVLMGSQSKIEAMPVSIHDSGFTELEPGTLTTGTERIMNPPLTREELKSLWLHRGLLSHLVTEPNVILQLGLDNITRWRNKQREDGMSSKYFDRWENVINEGVESVAQMLTNETREAIELRANSPFAGALSEFKREVILRNFRAHLDSQRSEPSTD